MTAAWHNQGEAKGGEEGTRGGHRGEVIAIYIELPCSSEKERESKRERDSERETVRKREIQRERERERPRGWAAVLHG